MSFMASPEGHGLLVSLDTAGTGWMSFVQDAHVERIHPHLHIPASLQHVVELGGGGSGVTIVRGLHKEFGDVVIKHGGHRDTKELFALVTIEEELRQRGRELGAQREAADMQARTPDFRFVYVSQDHLREYERFVRQLPSAGLLKRRKSTIDRNCKDDAAGGQPHIRHKKRSMSMKLGKHGRLKNLVEEQRSEDTQGVVFNPVYDSSAVLCQRRQIRVGSQGQQKLPCASRFVGVDDDALFLCLEADEVGRNGVVPCGRPGTGYQYLRGMFRELTKLQEQHAWKFTLAQKAIGSELATQASSVLAKGKLEEETLDSLICEFLAVIRNLQKLTRPAEIDLVASVRQELKGLYEYADPQPSSISEHTDSFVGFAVKKNFDLTHGRFKRLRGMGSLFRSGCFHLPEAEALPGHLLGVLLQRGARLEHVFAQDPKGFTAFDVYHDDWLDLLELAVSPQGGAALRCIWTCGLTDSGLHNLFLDRQRIWLFDLGEPSLTSLPAFLTKFLFSFFHALGMQETGDGSWVNRFEPGDRLCLTLETTQLLRKAHEAFRETLRRFIVEVFEGDAVVCQLLVRYTILQLVSDAAFCLDKWEIKGGGVEGARKRPLEKWLWRALWDLYVSSYVDSVDWSQEVGCAVKRTRPLCDGCCFDGVRSLLRGKEEG